MQSRLVAGLRDAPELQQDRALRLVDDEHGIGRDQQHDERGDNGGKAHRRAPLSASDEVTVPETAGGSATPSGPVGSVRMFLPREKSITFGVRASTLSIVSR